MYVLIPELGTLSPTDKLQVQAAFAGSLGVLWKVLAAISCAGFFASLFMKGLPLHNTLDADWALKDKQSGSITSDESMTR